MLIAISAIFRRLTLIALLLSLFVGYHLLHHCQELERGNQQLAQTLKAQQQSNAHLAAQIDSLDQGRKQAQKEQDAMVSQQQHARLTLNNRIQQLKTELAHASCNGVSIDYPKHWVSGYTYRH